MDSIDSMDSMDALGLGSRDHRSLLPILGVQRGGTPLWGFKGAGRP